MKTGLVLARLRISIPDMMDLRVRTQPAPRFLFQMLHGGAGSLVATMPRDVPAVSIPRDLYPITRIMPQQPASDVAVIIYERQPNGRYDAIEVVSQGRFLKFGQFYEIACRSVSKAEAGSQSGYAYFVPSVKDWGTILQDGGYTVLDPSRAQCCDITRELLESVNESWSCGLIARARLQPSWPQMPAFSRVEISADAAQDSWMSYVDYLRLRSFRSSPPDLFVPRFRQWMKRLCDESGFRSWVFRKGMYFGDRCEWWGDRNPRRTEHEGLDFAEGVKTDGAKHAIPEGTPVRAIADGEIVAFLDDFLDKTIVVRHPSLVHNTDVFYTFYSHISPVAGGVRKIAEGEIIGRMGKSEKLQSHVHLTAAWIPQSIDPGGISMNHINPGFAAVVLVNLNSLIRSAGCSDGMRESEAVR